jgi:hypothetical protein
MVTRLLARPVLIGVAVAVLLGFGCVGSSAASPSGVQLLIVLDRTRAVADGSGIQGQVIITNHTGKPIMISDACDGWIWVGLVNKNVHFSTLVPLVGCAPAYLPVGTSRKPIDVWTIYSGCADNRQHLTRKLTVPLCAGKSQDIPNLPPGTYRTTTVLTGMTPAIASPPSVTVTLTRPAR